jgi:2-oxoisovalerate dehydrogenase E2 component (dihydrolipoyl transacylase)
MSNYIFKLPDIGEGVAQAEIIAWHAEVGATVEEDQPLVDVMTDKATVQIGCPVAGRIVSRKGEVGSMAAIGDELVVFATDSAPQPSSGPEGSVIASNERTGGSRPAAAASQNAKGEGRVSGGSRPLAAPAVRARAAALGLDLATIRGSGPDGRINHGDLDKALVGPFGRGRAEETQRGDQIEEVKVTGLRRQIAERMLEAKRNIPHFSYVEEVDVTALEALRADVNGAGDDRHKVTILSFVIRATVRALAAHPAINAHFDGEASLIRRFRAVHAGVATQTSRGLVVPVIRNAEQRDVWSIAEEIVRLSTAARAGKATRAELSGSTITVSSLGALGGIFATPIIKPPEVAIIGVNKITVRPVFREGAIVAARLMNLSCSFDHRVIDGFTAAAFIRSLKTELEAPARLLLSV